MLSSEYNMKQRFSSNEIEKHFVNFVFLYIRWSVDRESKNDFDSFPIFLLASGELKQMLKSMLLPHSQLMKFIASFIQMSKNVSKKALDYARQVNTKNSNYSYFLPLPSPSSIPRDLSMHRRL